MNLLRTLRMGALLLLTGLTVSSCLEPPEYPETPTIDFERITSQRISDASGTYDKVTITVSFRDGDGDLGLNEADKTDDSPWARIKNGLPNPYYNNYYLTPSIRNAQGDFVELELPDPSFNYNSTYPPLATDDREAPLRGELNFTYDFYVGSPFTPGQTVRFNVSIFDRALNQSNTVTTDPITIPR
ncbi:hypothetical protein [Hymenobacter sp. HDW8]|uniref:hypothetical protein n=1 Tax=Hymenobacter sp. HDW8 TaxID=2714932 RepID=UPI001408723F|nr:hypothetical protein [Hymenobacter sp. HDW8]QIL77740.1 hypothetical protein G7064_19275 [Hymenobacter sp. HDW8]